MPFTGRVDGSFSPSIGGDVQQASGSSAASGGDGGQVSYEDEPVPGPSKEQSSEEKNKRKRSPSPEESQNATGDTIKTSALFDFMRTVYEDSKQSATFKIHQLQTKAIDDVEKKKQEVEEQFEQAKKLGVELDTLRRVKETEAESYEARLKSKESEAVKAAEEGFKIRLKEELETNLAAKVKEFEEQVRLVRDLGVQLTAIKHERDEALELKEHVADKDLLLAANDVEIKRLREEVSSAEVKAEKAIAGLHAMERSNATNAEEYDILLKSSKAEIENLNVKQVTMGQELESKKSEQTQLVVQMRETDAELIKLCKTIDFQAEVEREHVKQLRENDAEIKRLRNRNSKSVNLTKTKLLNENDVLAKDNTVLKAQVLELENAMSRMRLVHSTLLGRALHAELCAGNNAESLNQ